MSIDRFPKKPCKTCGVKGHFTYQCFKNPKKALKRVPIKKVGKTTKHWFITRAAWLRHNPPTIDGQYWECYLQIHEWCPVRLSVETITLDHVISRSKAPGLRFNADNLRPACRYCNDMKGSKSLKQVMESTGKRNLSDEEFIEET